MTRADVRRGGELKGRGRPRRKCTYMSFLFWLLLLLSVGVSRVRRFERDARTAVFECSASRSVRRCITRRYVFNHFSYIILSFFFFFARVCPTLYLRSSSDAYGLKTICFFFFCYSLKRVGAYKEKKTGQNKKRFTFFFFLSQRLDLAFRERRRVRDFRTCLMAVAAVVPRSTWAAAATAADERERRPICAPSRRRAARRHGDGDGDGGESRCRFVWCLGTVF